MKYLRFFETTQEQESKIGSIDYNAILFNNETGSVTMLNNEGSDTYTLRFIYVTENAEQNQTYFYGNSGNAPILGLNPVIKIDGEVVTPDPYNPGYTFATPGEHTIDFIINKEFKTIPNDSFGGSNFISVIIPDNINAIGDYAFSNFGKAENIIIPSSVTTIGSSAFRNAKHIEYYGSATWEEGDQYWSASSMN